MGFSWDLDFNSNIFFSPALNLLFLTIIVLLTLTGRFRQAGLLELDVFAHSPSAAAARNGVQTETDIVDIVDVPEIDGTADDEGPGGFLLRVAVVRTGIV